MKRVEEASNTDIFPASLLLSKLWMEVVLYCTLCDKVSLASYLKNNVSRLIKYRNVTNTNLLYVIQAQINLFQIIFGCYTVDDIGFLLLILKNTISKHT